MRHARREPGWCTHGNERSLAINSTTWRSARLAGGALVLAILVWRLGAAPFAEGLRSADAVAIALAVVVTGVTTACAARRWSVVAGGLGLPLGFTSAMTAYYRSQFLNVTLPGGVVGDVHRAVDHGRARGQLSRSVRAVAWERTAGQVVQIALSLGVLLVVASPVRRSLVTIVGLGLLAALVVTIVIAVLGRHRAPAKILVRVGTDLRRGVLAPRIWPWVLGASAVAAAGHVALFVVAARTVDSTVSVGRIMPIAVLVVLASAVPLNVAGWGPREGVAAWAFGAAGLGTTQGVTVSVVYGVMVLVATLPGAVVLIIGAAMHGHRRHGEQGSVHTEPLASQEVIHV